MVKAAVVQTSSMDGQGVLSVKCVKNLLRLTAAEAAEGTEWPTPEEDASGTRHDFFIRLNLSESYNLVLLVLCGANKLCELHEQQWYSEMR